MSANPEFPADTEGWKQDERALWEAGEEAESPVPRNLRTTTGAGVGGVGPVVQVEGGPDLDRVVDGAAVGAHGPGSA